MCQMRCVGEAHGEVTLREGIPYYLAIKRSTFESVLMRWMNLEPIIQSEVSQRKIYIIH